MLLKPSKLAMILKSGFLCLLLAFETGCTKPKEMIMLSNARVMEVRIIPYGGIVTSIRVPDRNGRFDDVVLGYDDADAYRRNNGPYMRAIVGRYGNRIARGMFTLDGQIYQLATNNGPNHLHGGNKGFDKVMWQAEEIRNADGVSALFRYTSVDLEEGYPGTLKVQ